MRYMQMKKISGMSLFIITIAITAISCRETKIDLVGSWKMDGVGAIDSTNAKGNIVGYAMISIMSNGIDFVFTDNGSFNISNQGKPYVTGTYTIDGKKLTLKASNSEENYDLTQSDQKVLMLKSNKDQSVINRKRE